MSLGTAQGSASAGWLLTLVGPQLSPLGCALSASSPSVTRESLTLHGHYRDDNLQVE